MTEEATMPEVVTELPQEAQEVTPLNWEEIFRGLANPNCKKCYGRGFVGHVETPKGRMPKACVAKRCSMHKFYILQQQARRQQLLDKQKKAEEVKEGSDDKREDISGS
jgi:hypothetical protein